MIYALHLEKELVKRIDKRIVKRKQYMNPNHEVGYNGLRMAISELEWVKAQIEELEGD